MRNEYQNSIGFEYSESTIVKTDKFVKFQGACDLVGGGR